MKRNLRSSQALKLRRGAVAALKANDCSIHFHLWDFDALEAMLRSLQTRGWPLKLESLERNGDENVFVLRATAANFDQVKRP